MSNSTTDHSTDKRSTVVISVMVSVAVVSAMMVSVVVMTADGADNFTAALWFAHSDISEQ